MQSHYTARGIALLVLVCSLVAVPSEAQPPSDYNLVKTNFVFKDFDPGGWAGSGTNGRSAGQLSHQGHESAAPAAASDQAAHA